MSEWFKEHAWKVCIPRKGIQGSNPCLSADPNNAVRMQGIFVLEPRQASLSECGKTERPRERFANAALFGSNLLLEGSLKVIAVFHLRPDTRLQIVGDQTQDAIFISDGFGLQARPNKTLHLHSFFSIFFAV